MKRLAVLTALLFTTLPVLFAADEPCGCGETKQGQPRGGPPCACPIFPMDADVWYCDYYDPTCNDPPQAVYLPNPCTACWDCLSGCCVSRIQLANRGIVAGDYPGPIHGPDFKPSFPTNPGEPHATVPTSQGAIRFVTFDDPRPGHAGQQVYAKVFRLDVSFEKYPLRRYTVAYQVSNPGVSHSSVPIGSLGYGVRVNRKGITELYREDPLTGMVSVIPVRFVQGQ